MAKRFDFWTHGIATVLENPERAEKILRATDIGTRVEQKADVEPIEGTWFHIPITTPTVMEGDTTIYLRRVGLRAKVNENARVVRIHIRRGTDLIIDLNVNHIGTTIEETYNVPDQLMGNNPQAGLAMSIKVEFLTGTPRGQIEFQGAGAHFS